MGDFADKYEDVADQIAGLLARARQAHKHELAVKQDKLLRVQKVSDRRYEDLERALSEKESLEDQLRAQLSKVRDLGKMNDQLVSNSRKREESYEAMTRAKQRVVSAFRHVVFTEECQNYHAGDCRTEDQSYMDWCPPCVFREALNGYTPSVMLTSNVSKSVIINRTTGEETPIPEDVEMDRVAQGGKPIIDNPCVSYDEKRIGDLRHSTRIYQDGTVVLATRPVK